MFDATKHVFCRDKSMFFLDKHIFVVTKHFSKVLSRQTYFCRDTRRVLPRQTRVCRFVATKTVLVAAPVNDIPMLWATVPVEISPCSVVVASANSTF